MTIHPKTSGAAVGSALGILIVSVVQSIHGIHLSAEAYSAFTSFLAIFGAWLVPANDVIPVTGNQQPPPPPPPATQSIPPPTGV